MATLIDNAASEWVSNEVYQIEVTDPCQGHGVGSSFGGLGIHNQPHQQLANRTAFLKQRQDTNIAAIAALNVFAFEFIGNPQPNGWLTVPVTITPGGGNAFPTLQWGFVNWFGLDPSAVENEMFTVTLSKPFATAMYWAGAFLASNNTAGAGAMSQSSLALETITPFPPVTTGNFQIFADFNSTGVLKIASATKNGLTGFYWLAIGK